MLKDWFERAREEFERGVLGKGRPNVGSRRRDRLPKAGAAPPPARTDQRVPSPPEEAPPAAYRARYSAPRRTAAAPMHLGYTLAFAVVIGVMIMILLAGIKWAADSEGGLLSAALGAGSDSQPLLGTPTPPGPTPDFSALLPTPTLAPTAAPSPTPRTYTVKAGDTLNQIARQHNTSVEALVEANNLSDPRLLRIGQELVIPGGENQGG